MWVSVVRVELASHGNTSFARKISRHVFQVGWAICDQFQFRLSALHGPTSMESTNHFKDYFVTMDFEMLPEHTENLQQNSLRRNSGHPATSKQTLSIRFPAVNLLGVILEKTSRRLQTRKKNMSMSSIATKAPTFKTIYGWTIIKTTLITLKQSTRTDVVCEKLSNHDTLP